MKKIICLLSVLFMLTLLIPTNQAGARGPHGYGWILPGLIIGGILSWGLASHYYYPYYYYPYYYPVPRYYPPPPEPYYPPSGEVREAPPVRGKLFIYPRKGQSPEKQASDRNECHKWAVDQSGYDPTNPPPNDMAQAQVAQKSGDYLRAMSACLDAQGYSMR